MARPDRSVVGAAESRQQAHAAVPQEVDPFAAFATEVSFPTCLACGAPVQQRAIVLANGAYSRCSRCGLESLDPLPTDVGTKRLFVQGYFQGQVPGGYADYDADGPLHQANAAARLELVRRYLGDAAPEAVLDVGCAVGHFLAAAAVNGARVVGVDVSKWARDEARRRHGIEAERSIADVAVHSPGAFDVVTFFQSLEHMSRPDLALATARSCLRPGGLLVIETWDAGSTLARWQGKSWQQMNPPTVVHLFTRPCLDVMLVHAGFAPVAIEVTGKLVSAGLVLHILAGKFPRSLGWLDRLARWPAVARLRIRYRLGDLVTVVARASATPAA